VRCSSDLATGEREEQRCVAVLVEWVLAAKKLFSLDQEGRHPCRIVRVNSPRKLDEGVTFGARLDRSDFYLRHDVDFSVRAAARKTEMTLQHGRI
jgi:hypothetical protein